MTTRAISHVVRLRRLADVDEHAERRTYWATRSIAERIAEVESLRRLWPEVTGDADAPIMRVVHKRKLGDPALEHHCRVCGLRQAAPPWGDDGRCPTYEICDCCGVEFGYEDATLVGVTTARSEWLAKGAPWFAPQARPVNWDLAAQVRKVPAEFR